MRAASAKWEDKPVVGNGGIVTSCNLGDIADLWNVSDVSPASRKRQLKKPLHTGGGVTAASKELTK
jgi:hypothetical protein